LLPLLVVSLVVKTDRTVAVKIYADAEAKISIWP